MGCFEALPIAAVLTTFYGRFLCVHGGISEDIQTLKDIEDINRFVEPPMSGPLCDVLWADPMRDAVMVDYCSGKYFKRRSEHREWSTVVDIDISIPPPSFKLVLLSLSRFSRF